MDQIQEIAEDRRQRFNYTWKYAALLNSKDFVDLEWTLTDGNSFKRGEGETLSIGTVMYDSWILGKFIKESFRMRIYVRV